MSQPASSAVSKTTFFMWITGWVLTVLVTVLLCFSASMKLMRVDEAVKGFEAQKMGHLLIAIGITEVACAIIYAVPWTAVLGAILVTGYLGGAVLMHLQTGDGMFFGPIVVGVVAWLGLWFRDRRVRELAPWRRR